MKLSILAKDIDGWHIHDLKRAGEEKGIKVEAIKISPKLELEKQAEQLGDVILWRSSFLDHDVARPAFGQFLKSKHVINEAVFKYPLTPQKYFQQKKLKSIPTTKKYSIPTHLVKEGVVPADVIERFGLEFPMIMKPNLGAMGVEVELLKTADDPLVKIKTSKDMVLQPFIKNSGDWRVIVVGGVPLGAMKRVAASGSHLNNISQGAKATEETDPNIRGVILHLAVKATAAMGLRFAGVDVIKSDVTGKYHILETNSVPQWDGEYGFQSVTGIDVASEIVDYAVSLHNRKKKVASSLIEDNYKKHITLFPSGAFHLASRLWLWTGDQWSRDYLDKARDSYIGKDETELREKIEYIFSRPTEIEPENARSPHRLKYYKRYSELRTFLPLLFKVIFAESIYGVDIRPYVKVKVSNKEFLDLFHKIINDPDAIRILSTHAANYFYLLKYYFKGSLSESSAVIVDPSELREIAKSYKSQVEAGELDAQTALKMKVYLLTHAVIGEARFYQRSVKSAAFRTICQDIEKEIRDNYFDITLDNKLEFLVCCKLTGYKSTLRTVILSESRSSLSWAGNFLVDTLNNNAEVSKGHNIRSAEHRSALYLMAKNDFKRNKKDQDVIHVPKKDLPVIGRLARVVLKDFNVRMIARVDSGATKCSLAVSDIVEQDGQLSFCIGRKSDPFHSPLRVAVEEFSQLSVKTTTKSSDVRYTIPINITLKKKTYYVECTLADREHMLYPMLLGRSLLTKRFIVNTSKQFA